MTDPAAHIPFQQQSQLNSNQSDIMKQIQERKLQIQQGITEIHNLKDLDDGLRAKALEAKNHEI